MNRVAASPPVTAGAVCEGEGGENGEEERVDPPPPTCRPKVPTCTEPPFSPLRRRPNNTGTSGQGCDDRLTVPVTWIR
eukprot:CAMPEP_0171864288 /NCGR_PEP_ID=MMETSP0992-20121227/28766_1 /TAXON_ID=483369 /ORGANISM="non described non described, Strain CCMP2098" /LENGTH=77 /DNA_ID=CAMNT_0012486827 /DNA_START=224 /DNA_END=454 /DNA_ORIENTATION=+